ncbi:MAG TPA: PorP/SprF family type IX secretion system membrane protein [Bacteroidia bacterium]|nr:PorP/SprF family type IX secretion system membrane protein [Bacteroidia bacterium]HNT80392.1 PorP/SprF family type IX secretion system membrane protein [Bacteroidia bacterium]
MKNAGLYIKTIIALLLGWVQLEDQAYAQDIHSTLPFVSKSLINPALSIQNNNDFQASMHYRNQWNSVSTPYKNVAASVQSKFNSKGLSFLQTPFAGINIVNDKAGDLDYGMFSFEAFAGFQAFQTKDSLQKVTFFVAPGFVQRAFNTSNIRTPNQFDGDVYDPSIFNGENFDRTSFSYFNFSVGLNWTMQLTESLNMNHAFSVQHMNQPKQSFYAGESKLPMNFIFYSEADLELIENITITPYAQFMNQRKNRELLLGAHSWIKLSDENWKKISAGMLLSYRIQDAISTGFLLRYNQWTAALSYDFNTSTLRKASNGKGGTELAIQYAITKVKPPPNLAPCKIY